MAVIALIFTVFYVLYPPVAGAADCVDDKGQADYRRTIERINQRYDDFFSYRRYIQERQERIQAAAVEVRGRNEARAVEMERARRAYIANRRPRPDDEPMRLAWEAQQNERLKKHLAKEECYARQRHSADEFTKKGRAIPGLEEFGLDEY